MIPDPARLTGDLNDARARELSLFEGLSEDHLLGTRKRFLEPPIWELGHVGWTQEYWILRHLDGSEPLVPDFDGIYDAFNVSYKLRWDHPFPSLKDTVRYITDILKRCTDRLNDRSMTKKDVYFYRFVAQHEDMA